MKNKTEVLATALVAGANPVADEFYDSLVQEIERMAEPEQEEIEITKVR